MRILLTGASGALGRHLTIEFLSKGVPVCALVHRQAPWIGPVVSIKGDVSLPGLGIKEEVPRLDAIVNAAGLVSFDNRDREALGRVNTGGALNCADLAVHWVFLYSTSPPRTSVETTKACSDQTTCGGGKNTAMSMSEARSSVRRSFERRKA
jgi:nucleoside-diphosphate-sugar epimerase